MPTLPLVKRSVLPSVQQAAQASPEAAGLEGRATASIGGQIAQLGGEMVKVGAEIYARKQKLEIEANVADYELSREAHNAYLDAKVTNFITSGGNYKDVINKVYVPERQKFLQEISKKGYNPTALSMVEQRIQMDSAIMDRKMQANVDKMQMEDYVETNARYADSMIATNPELHAAKYKELEGAKGAAWVFQRKSLGLREYYRGQMRALKSAKDSGSYESDGEYIEKMSNLMESFKNSGASTSHIEEFATEASAEINKSNRAKARELNKVLQQSIVAFQSGEVDTAILQEWKEKYGQNYADAIKPYAAKAMSNIAMREADARPLIDMMNNALSGKGTNLYGMLKETGNLSDGDRTVALAMIGLIADDMVARGDEKLFYSWLGKPSGGKWGTVVIPESEVKDFWKGAMSTLSLTEKNHTAVLNGLLRDLSAWKEKPESKGLPVEEFFKQYATPYAAEFASKQVAPQVKATDKPADNDKINSIWDEL